MEKQEFLDKLRMALVGKVDADVVTDTIRYYEDYISSEVRMGRDEGEVLTSLGDPRWLAKTIVTTKGNNQTVEEEYSDDSETEQVEPGLWNAIKHYLKVMNWRGWAWLIGITAIVILLLGVLFRVLIAFAPFLIIAGIIIYFVNSFNRR